MYKVFLFGMPIELGLIVLVNLNTALYNLHPAFRSVIGDLSIIKWITLNNWLLVLIATTTWRSVAIIHFSITRRRARIVVFINIFIVLSEDKLGKKLGKIPTTVQILRQFNNSN